MKKAITILAVLTLYLIMSSCSKSLLISNGAKDHKPLIFNNEYKISNIPEIEIQGKAFCGIPSNSKNNKNKNGFLITFNGVPIGNTPSILPVLTLIGYSFVNMIAINSIVVQNSRLNYIGAYGIGLPIAGILNNLTCNNSALIDASSTLAYKLVKENPDVDVFFYPKYNINKKNGLFVQEATLIVRVSAATLINK